MHYQLAETPEMTGPQFQAKAAQVKQLIEQRKTHQAAASTRKPLFVQRHVLERELAELKAKPGSQRASSAELDRLKAENATLKGRLAAAPATTASRTPHLDEFARLKGAEATSFYRQHSKAIAAEQTLAGLIAKHPTATITHDPITHSVIVSNRKA